MIVESKSKVLGNFYIHTDNSIGINFYQECLESLPKVYKMITDKWEPLPEILSVRNKNFFVNSPSANDALISTLKKMGAKHMQSSYILEEC